MTQPQSHVFEGLKVLDIASFIAGPAATTMLADYGADVIKIEPPRTGDPYRAVPMSAPYPHANFNYGWQLNNRNKRSLSLDLKSADARQILLKLVAQADVVVTNFPPNVKAKLGLTYADLSAVNPRLIYADLTGFGAEGAEANKPGFDITAYWASSGLMDVTHDASSPPALPIPGFGDHAVATTLYSAILTGLYLREKTGQGRYVSTSLLANGAWAAADWLEGALNGAKFPPQHDRRSPPSATFNTYRTGDHRWFLIVVQEKDWPGLAAAVGKSELVDDPRFASAAERSANAAELVAILDDIFGRQPLAYWRATLDAARVIHGVVHTLQEMAEDEQAIANNILTPFDAPPAGAKYTVNSPVNIVGSEKVKPRRAPNVGEHSAEIISELGFNRDQLSEFIGSGAVYQTE